MVAHESGLSHLVVAPDSRAWRIVSEDSIHSILSLPTTVHPFPESKNLVIVTVALTTISQQRQGAALELEVFSLHTNERKPLEERHDPVAEIGQSIDLPTPATISCLPHRAAS